MTGRTGPSSVFALFAFIGMIAVQAVPLFEVRSANLTVRQQQNPPPYVDMYDQLKSALPFVQFELKDSRDHPKKPFVIDLKDCGSQGLDKVDTVRVMRRADQFGQNAVRQCQAYLLQPILSAQDNRFGIHASDTSSVKGLAAQDSIKLIQTDPLFYDDQRFQLKCQKPSDQDKDQYFGVDCFILAKDSKCLAADGYGSDAASASLQDTYPLSQSGDCETKDDKLLKQMKWNVKIKSKCFTQGDHLIGKKAGDKSTDVPEGC